MQQQISNEYPWQPQSMNNQDEEIEVDLSEVFDLFWGHLRQIIAWLVFGAAVGGLYSCAVEEPQYQSTAQVYIESPTSDIDDAMMVIPDLSGGNILLSDVANAIISWQRLPNDTSLQNDYKELLLSRTLLQDVLKNLSLDTDCDMNYEDLKGMITFGDTESTHIVKIVVTSPDAQMSSDIANELVSQGEIYYRNFVWTEPPKVLESAEAPSHRLDTGGSNSFRNAVLGGLFTAVLYCGFLLVCFMMNDKIATPNDVVKYFGVQPLATIPKSNPGNVRKDRAQKGW